jgi:DNA-binding transcriptional ArsR family regulator
MENFEFKTDKIEKAAQLLKAVAHPLRLKLLKLIHEKKEVHVNVLYHTLKIEQSITSQHLKVLRGVDAVKTRRDGKKIFYSINYVRLEAMQRGLDLFDDWSAPKAAAKKKK